MAEAPSPLRVLLLEPFLSGSHRAWAEGYAAASAHEVTVLGLPGRFWKWRMHGAAVTLARRARDRGPWDALIATDMLDTAAFAGLARNIARAPLVVYFHENQLAYPHPDPGEEWTASRRRRAARRDEHYPFVNLTSALAADEVWWNSAYNRDSFLEALPGFLRRFPDFRETGSVAAIRAKSRVVPLGIAAGGAAPAPRPPGPPRILWNHRWEYDKDPHAFLSALRELAQAGHSFEVVILGEGSDALPEADATVLAELGDRVVHQGWVPDRGAYEAWLGSCTLVVSTARQEFFGAAVWEAVARGCRPVLPARLAYPELVPAELHDSVLYHDGAGLLALLERCLREDATDVVTRLRSVAAAFAWRTVAADMDARLTALVAGATGRPAHAVWDHLTPAPEPRL